jgi:hypothetical protein
MSTTATGDAVKREAHNLCAFWSECQPMMQYGGGHGLKRARIVDDRQVNINFVNCPGWVITRGSKNRQDRPMGITFAVKLG